MNPFLDALCDEDYSKIIISGNPSIDIVNEAWIKILIEFYEIRGDNVNTIESLRLQRDITRTKHHLFLLDKCVIYLRKSWSESIANSVRQLGYVFDPMSKIPDQYSDDLDIIVNQSKTKYIQLQQFIKQLTVEMEKIKNVTPKRDGFEKNLLDFEEMQRTTYSFDNLTVSKYLQLEKKYTKMVERINAKPKK